MVGLPILRSAKLPRGIAIFKVIRNQKQTHQLPLQQPQNQNQSSLLSISLSQEREILQIPALGKSFLHSAFQ